MAPFHYFCGDAIAASRKLLGCGPGASATTALPSLPVLTLYCPPGTCLHCLHAQTMLCRVLSAWWVKVGVGLAGSAAGCSGSPRWDLC